MQASKKRIIIIAAIAVAVAIIGVAAFFIIRNALMDDGPICEHKSLEYRVVTAATCTAEGSQLVVCKDCQAEIETTSLPKTAHDYEKDASSKASTCTAAGLDVYKCKNCDAKTETVLSQLKHEFVKKTDECSDADCISAGKSVSYCANCNAQQVDYIAALGHDWALLTAARTTELKAGDCVARKCQRCQEEAQATEKHKYEITSDTATCTEAGVKTFTCSGCNDSYTEVSEVKGHNVEEWVLDESFTPTLVSGTTCTYTHRNKGTCTVCENPVTDDYTADVHKYTLSVTREATCTTEGEKKLVCQGCGQIKTGSPVVKYYAEHTYTDVGGVLTCSCGETRKVVTGNSAPINKNELNQEIELGTGAVIRLPDTIESQISGTAPVLGAEEFGKSELPAGTAGLDRVGDDDTIYNITLTDGETPITNFDSGNVTVKLPYTLSEGEDPSCITIFYLADDGIELIEAVFTETNATTHEGYVIFETDHFSYYLVGLYSDSELCQRFGHEYLVSIKDPTCTAGGYHIEHCKRCGEYGTKEIYPATGHTPVLNSETSVAANCTENGHNDYTCAVCGYEYTVVTVAKGHSFVSSESVKASCTAPGKRVEKCSVCEVEHSINLPQLQHKLKSEVVDPTCTEGGYTIHSCTTCDEYNYKNTFTEPTGHTWNIEAPTCGQGQLCDTCGANGLPATNQHNMVGGACSVCAYGCAHTDNEKSKLEATCQNGGYTIYECTKCKREEKRDFTVKTAHNFPGKFDSCTVCGAVNATYLQTVKNMIAGLQSNGFGVRIENFSMSVKMSEWVDESKKTTEGDTITLSLGELYIVRAETGLMLYLNGTATNEEGMGGRITAYGDGKTLYLEVEASPDKLDGKSEAVSMSIAYSVALKDAILYLNTMLPPAEDDGDGTEPQEPTAPVLNEDDLFASLEEVLGKLLDFAIAHPLAQPVLALFDAVSENALGLYANMLFTLFEDSTIETGYKYTLNTELLNEYLDNMHSLTIAEFIDEYAGEGATDKIFAYILASEKKDIPTLVLELLTFADAAGLPSELVIDLANTVFTVVMNGGYNPEAPVVNIMDFLDAQFAGVKITDLAGIESYAEPVKTVKKTLEDNTFFEAFEMLTDMPEGDVEILYNTWKSLLNDEVISISFTTDKLDRLVSYEVAYKSYSYTVDDNYEYRPGAFKHYQTNVSINGTMTFSFSASIPENAAVVKDNHLNKLAVLEAGIKTEYDKLVAENPEATEPLFLFDTFRVAEGKIYITLANHSGSEPTFIEVLLSDVDGIQIMDDCLECYRFSIVENLSIMASGTQSTSEFVFNSKTGAFSYQSFCNFGTEYTDELPEGYYRTYDEAPCGEVYGKVYKCTCGNMIQAAKEKDHILYDTVELAEGTDDCKDGVVITSKCVNCDHVEYGYDYGKYQVDISVNAVGGWWSLESDEFWRYTDIVVNETHRGTQSVYSFTSSAHSIPGEDNKTILFFQTCPCGRDYTSHYGGDQRYLDTGILQYNSENACRFGEWFDYDSNGDEVADCKRANCAFEGCTAYILKTTATAADTDYPCTSKQTTNYKVYCDGKLIVSRDVIYRNTVHTFATQPYSVNSPDCHSYEIPDRVYEKCTGCGATRYREIKYDAYGREVLTKLWMKDAEGYYLDYYLREVKYDGLCNYTDIEIYNSPDAEPYEDRGIDHAYEFVSDIDGVYIEKCLACGTEHHTKEIYAAAGGRHEGTHNRLVERIDWEIQAGSYKSYLHEKWVYASPTSCEYEYLVSNKVGTAPKLRYTGTNCGAYSCTYETCVREGTCTQPAYFIGNCCICGTERSTYYRWARGYYDATVGGNQNYYGGGHAWKQNEAGSEFAYECMDCGLKSDQGASGFIALEDLTNHPVFGTDGSKFVIGYSSYHKEQYYNGYLDMQNTMINIAFVPKGEKYSDASVLNAILPDINHVMWTDAVNNGPIGGSGNGGNISVVKRNAGQMITFTKESIMASAQALIDAGHVSLTTPAEVLAAYDLAVVFSNASDPSVGSGLEGAYVVIVLEDLPTYFAG